MVFSQISKLTIFLALYIIISASFMFQVFKFIRSRIGPGGLMTLVGLALVISALIFLTYTIIDSVKRKKVELAKTLVVVVALIMILILAWQIENFAERIHIAEFAVLGWLATRDLTKVNKKIKGAIFACLFCILVGLLDEIFQWILPYRFFDLNDIAFNSLGGGWGVVLYLLTQERRK